ncbi:MAG: PD-(D/E)XK nuclease family protein [Acidimicrobiia bacterium]|nr:PD-(D/E)XK nuclease family protein [Acidimicrobiia bacterium]
MLPSSPPAATGRSRGPLRAEAVRAALAEQRGALSAVASHPATVRALARTFTDLRRAGPAARARLARRGPRPEHVVRCFDAFCRHTEGFADDEDLAAAAVGAVDAGGPAVDGLGGLVVHLPRALSPAELTLVGAFARRGRARAVLGLVGEPDADRPAVELAERLATVLGAAAVEPAAPSPARVSVLEAPDPDDEVREVVRSIVARLDRVDLPLHRVAILYRTADPYARVVHEQLRAAGIPAHGPATGRLAETVAGRALLGLLAVPAGGYRRDAVMDWLASAPILEVPGTAPVPAHRWDVLSRRAGVVGGIEQWRDRLAGYGDHLRRRAERAADDPEADGALDVEADLDHLDRLGAFVDGLAGALEPPDPRRGPRSPAGRPGSSTGTSAARGHASGGPSTSCGPPARCGAGSRPWATSASWRGPAAPRTSTSSARRSRPGSTSRGATPDASAPESSWGRCAMPTASIPTSCTCSAWSRAPSRPGGARTRSCPTTTARSAGSRSPGPGGPRSAVTTSPPSEERASRSCAGRGPTSGPSGSACRPAGCWPPRPASPASTTSGPASSRRARVRGTGSCRRSRPGSSGPRRPPRRSTSTSPTCAGGSRPAGRCGPTRASGRSPPSATGSRPSPRAGAPASGPTTGSSGRSTGSSPTSPAPCRPRRWSGTPPAPRRYLLEQVLRVHDVERPEDVETISALDRGSLVHEVLEVFLRSVPARRRPDAPWTPAERDRLLELAERCFDDAVARGLTGRPLLWAMERRRLRRVLRDFADADEDHRSARGVVTDPDALELVFGDDAGEPVSVTLPGGTTVAFRGRIDRIDVAPDGSRLVVLDYKTGRDQRYTDLEDDPVVRGTMLQLPIYALAATRRAPEAAVEARYWFLETGRQPGYAVDDTVMGRFLAVLEAIFGGIAAGVFPANPGAETRDSWANCRTCPYDRLCPPDRDVAWERKRHAPTCARYLALAEPGAAPPGEGP